MLVLALCIFCISIAAPGAAAAAVGNVTASPADTADEQTTRIVSLVPNLTELAFELGAGPQVVGVSDFCSFPPEVTRLPAVGGLVNPSLEQVVRLRPTVVLLYRSQQDFSNKLSSLGIRSELFQVDTLADLYAGIDRMATITGETTSAAALSRHIRSSLDSIVGKAGADAARPVAGAVVVSRDPAGLRALYQAGPSNFLGELFEIAGGKVAIPGKASISAEEIIRANPHLIIDMSGAEQSGSSRQDKTTTQPVNHTGAWSALSTVPAVRSSRVYQWNNPHSLLLGPSVINTAETFRRLIVETSTSAR